MSATALAEAFRAGRLSPVVVCSAVLDRIEAADPLFRPFLFVDRDGALAAASESAARWAAGAALGPLDGVPMSLKLHMRARGMPTMMGCGPPSRLEVLDDHDEPAVARLRAAGLVLTGKTLSPENPYVASSLNRLFGTCGNPWNPERTAGGSSSGAAAAAAARLGPLHLGSDGGGSIRLPASYCGVAGLKPSHGVIPEEGEDPFRAGAYGPIGAELSDLLAVMEILAPDLMRGPADGPVRLAGARVGLCRWVGGDARRPTAAVVARLDAVGERLARAGAEVVEVQPFLPDGWWIDLVRGTVATYALEGRAGFSAAEFEGLASGYRELVIAMERLTDADRAALNRRWQERPPADPLQGLDVLLLATTPDVAHPADLPWPAEVEPDPFNRIAMPHVAQTGFFNFRDYPAGTLPMGFVEGLPVGLQVATARGTDRRMLGWMQAIANMLDGVE